MFVTDCTKVLPDFLIKKVMNKIFKSIWSKRRGCYVAVSENKTALTKKSCKAYVVLASALIGISAVNAEATVTDLSGEEPFSGTYGNYETDWVVKGSPVMSGEYFGKSVVMASSDPSSPVSLTITEEGKLNLKEGSLSIGNTNNWDFTAGHEQFTNNGTITVEGGTLSYRGSSGDSFTGTGSINASGVYLHGDHNISQGSIETSRMELEDASLTLNSLTGDYIDIRDENSSLIVKEGEVNGLFSNYGEAEFNNLTLSGLYHGKGKLIVHDTLRGGTIGGTVGIGVQNSDGFDIIVGKNLITNPNLVNTATIIQKGGHSSISTESYSTFSGSFIQEGGETEYLVENTDGDVTLAGKINSFGTCLKKGGSLVVKSEINDNKSWFQNDGGTAVFEKQVTLNRDLENDDGSNTTFKDNVTIHGLITNGRFKSYGTSYLFFEKDLTLDGGSLLNDSHGVMEINGKLELGEKSEALNRGIFRTSNLLNFFDSLGGSKIDGLHYITLGGAPTQETKTARTELFQKYAPGKVKDLNFLNGIDGKIVFTDVNLTQAQVDSLTNALRADPNFAQGSIEFQGNISKASDDDKLNTAKVNELYENVSELRGVIYTDRKLEGENSDVVIGKDGLKYNSGFAGINEAESTTIKEGRELTLIGAKIDGKGTLYAIAEKVINVIGEGSKLILGSLGLSGSRDYAGTVKEINVSNQGEFKVAAGNYQIENFSSVSGKATVDKGAVLAADKATFTINSEFTNNGIATIKHLSGHTGSILTNNESLTVEGETQFGGRLHNNKELRLIGTANIDGTLENKNGANLIANTVNVNGTLRNRGYMEALDNSTVYGTLENTGLIKLFNSGIETRGDINNTFALNATGKTQVSGLLSNAPGAVAVFHGENAELKVKDGGFVTNNGTLSANSLTIEEGGRFVNGEKSLPSRNFAKTKQTSSVSLSVRPEVSQLAEQEDAFFNESSSVIDKLKLEGGKIDVAAGLFAAKESALEGGEVSVGTSGENTKPAKAEFNLQTPLNSVVLIHSDGDLGLGPNALTFASSLGAPLGHGRLIVTKNITVGPQGGITVGSHTSERGSVKAVSGNLIFKNGSATVVDTATLKNGNAAFSSESGNSSVIVEPEAELILGNIENPGILYIVKGFNTEGNKNGSDWEGGWNGDNLYALAQDGTGINWILELQSNRSDIWVNAQLSDVRTLYPDIVVPNIVNKALDGTCNGGPDEQLICQILKDKTAGRDLKTKLLNSVVMIGQASGALSITNDLADNATDSIEKHLSFRDYGYSNGYLKDYSGLHLWADILGTHLKTKSLDGAGNMTGGYKAFAGGLILGADHQFEAMPSVRAGFAASFQKGKADSLGDYIDTKNKFSQWMLHGYVAKDFGNDLNWISSINVGQNISKASQGLPSWSGFSKADARIKNTVANVATKLEKNFQVTENFQVIPHVGARWLRTHIQGHTTKLNGQKAFSYGQTSTNLLQLPVGVGLQGEAYFGSWTVRPQADLTFTYNVGNLKNTTQVSGVSIGEMDSITNEFAERFASKVQAGFQVERGNATAGLQFGLTKGSVGKLDTGIKLEGRYRF